MKANSLFTRFLCRQSFFQSLKCQKMTNVWHEIECLIYTIQAQPGHSKHPKRLVSDEFVHSLVKLQSFFALSRSEDLYVHPVQRGFHQPVRKRPPRGSRFKSPFKPSTYNLRHNSALGVYQQPPVFITPGIAFRFVWVYYVFFSPFEMDGGDFGLYVDQTVEPSAC